jgi:hypothetical protein
MSIALQDAGPAPAAAVLVDGLTLSSAIEVPGTTHPSRRSDGQPGGRPVWRVEELPNRPLFKEHRTRWFRELRPGSATVGRVGRCGDALRIQIPGEGELVAWTEERRVGVYLHPGTAPRRAALCHLLQYLAVLDGSPVLPGACVSFPAGGVIFCAAANAGKSTLALALDAVGRPVLGDDHVVLEAAESGFLAHPSFRFIDASPEASLLFRPDAFPMGERESIRLATPPPTRPVPVTRIAFLERGEDLDVKRLSNDEARARLEDVFVTLDEPEDKQARAHRRAQARRLARAAVVLELTVPEGLNRLSAELDRLQALLVYS